MAEKEFRHIVRVMNTDLAGEKKIVDALRKIKGVSFMFSNLVCTLAGIDKNLKTGTMNETHIEKLNAVLKEPQKFGAPIWMFNRNKDPENGTDAHLLTSDLKYAVENDIKLMKKIRSYKGVRHGLGLPVRGQRTKSNFRRSKGKGLGVKKKAGGKAGRV